MICRGSSYLQTSPCGLSVCRVAYASISIQDAMVILEGHLIIGEIKLETNEKGLLSRLERKPE